MAKAQGLSHAVVHRIWRAHGLQPHRVETFKLSRDPEFVKKLRDVVGVYLHPPDEALKTVSERPNAFVECVTSAPPPSLASEPWVP